MSRGILELPPPAAGARIAYGPGPLHFGDLRLPPGSGPHPVVVAIHGGFWRARYDLGYFGHLCAALAAQGIASWNIEYRRVGDAGGGWPGTFDDVARAADHLRLLAPERGLDLGRVVSIGHSAGGHLALWLAARPRIPAGAPLHSLNPLQLRAAVALAGVSDLHYAWEQRLGDGATGELIGGGPAAYPERYAVASPAALLPLGLPQVLIHGSDDRPVPIAISQRYAAAAQAAGDTVLLHELPGAGHFEIVDPRSREWDSVAKSVAQALALA